MDAVGANAAMDAVGAVMLIAFQLKIDSVLAPTTSKIRKACFIYSRFTHNYQAHMYLKGLL